MILLWGIDEVRAMYSNKVRHQVCWDDTRE